MKAHMAENQKTEDAELLSSLIDFIGNIDGGINSEDFQSLKKQMLESGMTSSDLFNLLGDNFVEALINRPIIDVKIQKLSDTAITPTYAHTTDACADIYSDEDVVIAPGATKLVSTGIALAIPNGYVVRVYARSGLSAKTSFRLANSVGIIDSGYRDEIKVPVWNAGEGNLRIKKGTRIAQMEIAQSPAIEFYEIDNIKDIPGDRLGGFGSTDFSNGGNDING